MSQTATEVKTAKREIEQLIIEFEASLSHEDRKKWRELWNVVNYYEKIEREHARLTHIVEFIQLNFPSVIINYRSSLGLN